MSTEEKQLERDGWATQPQLSQFRDKEGHDLQLRGITLTVSEGVTTAALAPALQPLPAGGAAAAPAVTQYGNTALDFVVVRTGDNRLFWNSGAFRTNPSTGAVYPHWDAGWMEIPGSGRGRYAPAVTVLNDRIYVAVVGSDGGSVWTQSYRWTGTDSIGDHRWEAGWNRLPDSGQFSAGPAIASHAGGLMVLIPDASREIRWQFWHAASGWSGSWERTVPGGFRTDVAVGAASASQVVNAAGGLDHLLYVVARGGDGRIYYNSGVLGFWGDTWREIPGGGRTNHAPAVASTAPTATTNGNLVVMVRGTDDGIAYQMTKGESQTWSARWTSCPTGAAPRTPRA